MDISCGMILSLPGGQKYNWDSSGRYCNVFKLTSECFVEPKGVNRHSCTNIYACPLLCNSSSCRVYFVVVLAECTNDTSPLGQKKIAFHCLVFCVHSCTKILFFFASPTPFFNPYRFVLIWKKEKSPVLRFCFVRR